MRKGGGFVKGGTVKDGILPDSEPPAKGKLREDCAAMFYADGSRFACV